RTTRGEILNVNPRSKGNMGRSSAFGSGVGARADSGGGTGGAGDGTAGDPDSGSFINAGAVKICPQLGHGVGLPADASAMVTDFWQCGQVICICYGSRRNGNPT